MLSPSPKGASGRQQGPGVIVHNARLIATSAVRKRHTVPGLTDSTLRLRLARTSSKPAVASTAPARGTAA